MAKTAKKTSGCWDFPCYYNSNQTMGSHFDNLHQLPVYTNYYAKQSYYLFGIVIS
jgi:hypothetical protein